MNSDKKSDSISFVGKGKNVISTDTELHLDLFADPSKLKPVSKIVKMDKINEDSDSDDSHIVNKALNSDSDSVKSRTSSKSTKSRRSRHSSKSSSKSSSSSSKSSSSSRSSSSRSSKRSTAHKKLDDYMSNYNDIRASESRPSNDPTVSQNVVNQGSQPSSGGPAPQPQPTPYVQKYTTEREIRFRKMELLAILNNIKKRRELSKSYSMSSSIEDMEDEVRFHTDLEQKDIAVEFSKDGLLKVCQFMEVMNGTFDPFGLQLKGWHGQMKSNIDNYDGVFGELYEKYKHYVGKVEPEYKLMYMVFGSAASFHYSKQFVEQYGLEKLVDKNPELLQKIQANIASTLEKNIGKKDEPKDKTAPMPKMSQQQMYQQMLKEKQDLEGKLQQQDAILKQQQQHMSQQVPPNFQPQQSTISSQQMNPHLSKMMEIQQSQSQNQMYSTMEMKKPSGLNDLLARVKASGSTNPALSIPLVDTATSMSSRIRVVDTVDSDSIDNTDTVQSISKMRLGRRQRPQVSTN